jgi:hypothetical protein
VLVHLQHGRTSVHIVALPRTQQNLCKTFENLTNERGKHAAYLAVATPGRVEHHKERLSGILTAVGPVVVDKVLHCTILLEVEGAMRRQLGKLRYGERRGGKRRDRQGRGRTLSRSRKRREEKKETKETRQRKHKLHTEQFAKTHEPPSPHRRRPWQPYTAALGPLYGH